jgi:metal-dependent HD superfamily phosphatase/phosphodiesterase
MMDELVGRTIESVTVKQGKYQPVRIEIKFTDGKALLVEGYETGDYLYIEVE